MGCYRAIPIALVLIAAGWTRSLAAQQAVDSMVVVLKSLGVMTGQVTQIADGIELRSSLGSTTVLRFDQIACLADSLDAAYLQLVEASNLDDGQTLQRLFDWSLRNGLDDRAGELLMQAKSRGVDSKTQQLMQRRLESAAIESRRVRNQIWASDVDPPARVADANVTEIAEAIESLPAGAEGFFNQQIHSKLVIGCAAAKCHTRESESLALWHHGKGIANPRGLTRHNLYQVLKFVDRDEPARSKIIKLAQTAHGGQTKPSFDTDDVALQLLISWTYSVSRHPERYLTEVIQRGGSPAPATHDPPIGNSDEVSQVGFLETPPAPSAPPQSSSQPTESEGVMPADPCDPILFNRVHHPERTR